MNSTMATAAPEPIWNLERRESSGHLVWRKDSPRSRVRFRVDVEVLEFEKSPHEEFIHDHDSFSMSNISSTIVLCVTCVAAVALSIFLPWYILDQVDSY